MVALRLRNRIACYAAAITIILQQLNSQPDTSVAEAPTPLVRVRYRFNEESTWHPDELLTSASGETYVLVWGSGERDSGEMMPARFMSN